MRKLLAFFPLVLIPLIVGFGLRFDGNPTVRYAGNFILFVVLPLTAVAYVAVALALIMTGKLKLGTDEPVRGESRGAYRGNQLLAGLEKSNCAGAIRCGAVGSRIRRVISNGQNLGLGVLLRLYAVVRRDTLLFIL